jgi:hypothetical protein
MNARSIAKGNLTVIRSTWGSGIVMVTKVEPRLLTGVLIHTFPELATDADVAIPHGKVAPYPVVLQFDLYGTFYRSQVSKTVGYVPIEGVSVTGHDPYVIPIGVAAHLEHLGARRGLAVWRETERWRFKEEQLTEALMPLIRPFWSHFKW